MRRSLLFITLLLLLFSSYSSVSGTTPIIDTDATASWTVALYISADNNLEKYAQIDIDEILDAGVPSNVNVVILLDRNEIGDTKLYEVIENQTSEVSSPFTKCRTFLAMLIISLRKGSFSDKRSLFNF